MGHAVICGIEDFTFHLIAQCFKIGYDFFAGVPFVMVVQPGHIFHDKEFGLDHFYNSDEFFEQSVSGVVNEFSTDVSSNTETLAAALQ